MADKKNSDQFNNPFSALRGLSVSREQKPEKKPKAEPVKEQPPVKPESAREDAAGDTDFFVEMAGLGVREIEQDGLEKQPPRREVADVPVGEKSGSNRVGPTGGAARARREKRLRRGDVQPQAELDLHGVRADDVRQKVGWFLENAVFHGFEAVRIITGKGSHSDDGPVLRPLVEDYLDGPGRDYVVEWLRAPQKQGGDGAIIAFLKD